MWHQSGMQQSKQNVTVTQRMHEHVHHVHLMAHLSGLSDCKHSSILEVLTSLAWLC